MSMDIEWSRMARPQPDGYDTDTLLEMHPKVIRRVFDDGVWLGRIEVRESPIPLQMGREHTPAIMTQVRANQLLSYLQAWEQGWFAMETYLDYLHPWQSVNGGRGCSSGHHHYDVRTFPWQAVYVTVNDLQGCAQGMYHELAHLRLETMGIGIETHDGLLLKNTADELYDSPVRKDIKRPMSAVLHGTYAWIMFMNADLEIVRKGLTPIEIAKDYMAHNIPKIREGLQEIATYAKPTAAGEWFLGGMQAWGEEVTDEAEKVLGL